VSRAENVAQAFYEDPDLRDSLTDDEAEVLLRWAAEQAARLDASGADEAAFDELTGQLRRLVKQINRYAGEGAYTPPDEQAADMTAIAESASAVGLNALPAFSAQAAPTDPMEALTGLLASLTPASAPESPAESPVPPETPDEDFHDL
jgi:hypothetical protein